MDTKSKNNEQNRKYKANKIVVAGSTQEGDGDMEIYLLICNNTLSPFGKKLENDETTCVELYSSVDDVKPK